MSRVTNTTTALHKTSQGQEKGKTKKLTRAQRAELDKKIQIQTEEWERRIDNISDVRRNFGFQPTECRCTWHDGVSVCGGSTKRFSLVCRLHRRANCCGKTIYECRQNSVTCTECDSEKKHCKSEMRMVNPDEYLCGDCFTRNYSRCMFCHDMFYDPDKDDVAPELAQCGECPCSQPQPCPPGCMRCYS